jgi:hypothetical protein
MATQDAAGRLAKVRELKPRKPGSG